MTEFKLIGKYEILEEIGRGGFAIVYKARDTELDRIVALKVLYKVPRNEANFIERFQQEAQIAAELDHPNIVPVYDFGDVDGTLYLAMDIIGEGYSLRDKLVGQCPLSLEQILPILTQLADALDYLHQHKPLLTHRDIKPANVLLEAEEDSLKIALTDFGLVRSADDNARLTETGTFLGTAHYMAPEQADTERWGEITPLTDVYGLGVVAYEMLVGRVPFEGDTMAVLYAHAHKTPPSPLEIIPDLGKDLADVLKRALAKSPEERYPSAGALVDALCQVAETRVYQERQQAELAHLLAQAQAAREAGDWLDVQSVCVQAVQIDRMHRDALEMIAKATAELQRESAEEASRRLRAQRYEEGEQALAAGEWQAALGAFEEVAKGDPDFGNVQEKLAQVRKHYQASGTRESRIIDKRQIGKILATAESQVRLLGVVALDADWRVLAKKWKDRLSDNSDFKVVVLCESDNMLFSKSVTYDTDVAKNRRSFQALKIIRDRATRYFPKLLQAEGLSGSLVGDNGNIEIEIMHLPIPMPVVQVDDEIFVNLWLHESEDYFEEITQSHPWRSSVESYIETYFDPRHGRKYACGWQDEMLELFDHDRIPRGIYPRGSFYDTDYSQLVVWAFIFDRQGRLLIHRRSDNAKDNRGMWDKSVGGHVDLAQDVNTSRTVVREVIEELFREETKVGESDFVKWAVSDEEILFLGEWRPDRRLWYPFREINALSREWVFFRLRESQHLFSPRLLPGGGERRLRVIADVFLFAAGPALNDESLDELRSRSRITSEFCGRMFLPISTGGAVKCHKDPFISVNVHIVNLEKITPTRSCTIM